jgi:hypothetical protein
MTTRRRISADTLLRDCPEKRVGLDLPAPLSERLDDLVRLAEDVGDRTNRKELMASLILAAPEAGESLSALLRAYRQASARAARLDESTDESTIGIRTYRPGPRPRKRLH